MIQEPCDVFSTTHGFYEVTLPVGAFSGMKHQLRLSMSDLFDSCMVYGGVCIDVLYWRVSECLEANYYVLSQCDATLS